MKYQPGASSPLTDRPAIRSNGGRLTPVSMTPLPAQADDDVALTEAAVRDIIEQVSAISRRMLSLSQPYAAQYDLAPRGLWVLGRIRDGMVHPGDLAREFHVGPSLVTAETQRLIAAGLVTSEADPRDARRSRLALTAQGDALYTTMWADLTGAMGQSLGRCAPEERVVFLKVLAALAR